MDKNLEKYLKLRYPMEVVECEEGGYFAQYTDLPGCMAQGETAEEAVRELEAAKRPWMEACLESGVEIPPPHEPVPEYSGKFVVRLPKSLHRELATKAEHDGMSLNSYVLHLLSLAFGRGKAARAEPAFDVEAIAAAVQKRLHSWCPRMHRQLISELYGEPMGQLLTVGQDFTISSAGRARMLPAYTPHGHIADTVDRESAAELAQVA